MKTWVSLVVILAIASASRAGGDDEAIAAVRAVLDRQVVDWNRGNLDGFLSGYWNSPKVVFQSGGRRFVGWEAMRDRYRRRYGSDRSTMGRLAFSGLDVVALGPESVLARGRWQLAMKDGSEPGGLFTVVFRKFPEGWKIIHDHTSADDPAPAASAKRPG